MQWKTEETSLLVAIEKRKRLEARKKGLEGTYTAGELGHMVHNDIVDLVLQEAAEDYKEKHKEAVKRWMHLNARFDYDLQSKAAIEMSKKMMSGELEGIWTIHQFSAVYMKDYLKQRPKRPAFRFRFQQEDMLMLIHRGQELQAAHEDLLQNEAGGVEAFREAVKVDILENGIGTRQMGLLSEK